MDLHILSNSVFHRVCNIVFTQTKKMGFRGSLRSEFEEKKSQISQISMDFPGKFQNS